MMKKLENLWKEIVATVNFDGIRCMIKGDPSIREIVGALKRQEEIDRNEKQH